MDFVNSVLSGLGVETGAGAYRAVVAENYAYFKNVKGIKSYKEDEIVLFLKKGEMCVRGERLALKKFGLGDVVIVGKIDAFDVKRG